MGLCKLCKEELKGSVLGCSKGTICMRCAKDISVAKYQPMHSHDTILWILAETFFRRGQGEDVNFEQIWSENENLTLVKFNDLIKGVLTE